MRFVASKALSAAAFFLATVAVLINAPSLFFMATALIATIGGCHLQAWLAVRALRFERVAPSTAEIGDLITVSLIVWSERRIRRPLVVVTDRLPSRLAATDLSPSLPIAPAYDLPVRTQYRFRPGRRGVFRWRGVVVEGTDALGIVSKRRNFATEETELRVRPKPIPVSVELPLAAGYGLSENESGQNRGGGLDFYGLREYVPGDPLRRVHWRSSARTGTLFVKEFEAGSHAAAVFLFPLELGSDIGPDGHSSLDLMVGHAAFLAGELVRQGARVGLYQVEPGKPPTTGPDRMDELMNAFTELTAERRSPLAADLAEAVAGLTSGSAVYIYIAQQETGFSDAVANAVSRGLRVAVLAYDARYFGAKNAGAVSDEYLDGLLNAGAHAIAMPGWTD